MMPSALCSVLFYVMAFLLIAMALLVVTSTNLFHSAIALTGSSAVSAGLLALLGADFLAISQLLVYVGGVMIIMLFVVMLSQQPVRSFQRGTSDRWMLGLLVSGTLCGYLTMNYRQHFYSQIAIGTMTPTTSQIGRLLLNQMLVPFEAVSLVLLTALVGAVVFGQDSESAS